MEQKTALSSGPKHDGSPSSLGAYRIVDRLASGGMASVYLGCGRNARGAIRLAAIKVMHPEMRADPEYVEMFLDEVRLTSAVRHVGVACVLEHGIEADLHYLTTEYVFGETWADLVNVLHESEETRALAPRVLTSILIRVCDALHAVHETHDHAGRHLAIVHRDVSPSNLMVCYDGSVKVVDFGIATACERLHETRDGVLKGHVGYMSPEQVRGFGVDRRCDLWPIGVMLWEGITGRRLFKRDNSRAAICAIALDPLEPLLALDELIPSALRPVLAKILERDPERRYATAQEVSDALRASCSPSELLTSDEIASFMQRLFAARFAERRKELKQKVAPFAKAMGATNDMKSAIVPLSPERDLTRGGRPDETAERDLRPGGLEALLRAQRSARSFVNRTLPYGSQLAALSLLAALGFVLAQSTFTGLEKNPVPSVAQTAPQARPGTVQIRSEGVAVIVELPGSVHKTTPLSVDLPPGRQTLRFHPSDGSEPVTAEFEVASGERYELLVQNAKHP